MERKGRNLSYDAGRKQAKILLSALLSFVENLEESNDCKADWQAGTELWVTHSTLEGLAELTKKYNDSLEPEAIRNALNCLISLKILQDKRGQTNAKTRTNSKFWLFALKFPSIDKEENLNWLFKQDGEWDKCREAQKNNSTKVPKTAKEKSQGVDWQEICGGMLEKHKRLTTNELLFADDEWKNSLNADAIVAEIVKWGFGEFKVEQNEWVEFLTPIAEGARTALPQTNRIKAIAALVELIGNSQVDDDTRRLAAKTLKQIDPGNSTAIPALVELSGNSQVDDDTRRLEAESSEQIDPGNSTAIAALVESIGNPQVDDYTRMLAAESLGKIGSGNEKAIAALVKLIGNPQVNYYTRIQVAQVLGKIGYGNQKAIAALVELISNSQIDDHTQWRAAESLGKIDPGNQKAIDALVELICNPQVDDNTRWLASNTLRQIMAEEQMPSLVTALKDYLSPETYKNDFDRFNDCYSLIWKCAQSMRYPVFYQAWHQ